MFSEDFCTPDIFGLTFLRAVIGSVLLYTEHDYGEPLPLLDNKWPSETTKVSPATEVRQARHNRAPSYLWDVSPPPMTEHQIDGTQVMGFHT